MMVKPRRYFLSIFLLLAFVEAYDPVYPIRGNEYRRQKTGVFYDWGSTDGLNFFVSSTGINSYITDNTGRVLKSWQEPDGYTLGGGSGHLTEEGTLLRTARPKIRFQDNFFSQPYAGSGRIREYDQDGVCIWEFRYLTELVRLKDHFIILPNGNILATAWENHPLYTARARGFDGEPRNFPDGYWSETLVEVPRGVGSNNFLFVPSGLRADGFPDNTCLVFATEKDIIWKWDSFDHSSNFTSPFLWDIKKEFEISAIDHLPSRDHIIISCKPCGEVFIIDHGLNLTDVPFRRGHFLYRWGNPSNYGRWGNQTLSADNVRWVKDSYGWKFGYEGRVTIYNNEDPKAGEGVSSVVQFWPPFIRGRYFLERGGVFGPRDFDYKIIKIQEKLERRFFEGKERIKQFKEEEEEEAEEAEEEVEEDNNGDGGIPAEEQGWNNKAQTSDEMPGKEIDMSQYMHEENFISQDLNEEQTENINWEYELDEWNQGRKLYYGQGLGGFRTQYGIPPFKYPWRNFFSAEDSSLQKLPNGNMIVTSSNTGEIFELALYDRSIWKYVSPFVNTGRTGEFIGEDTRLGPFSDIPECYQTGEPCNAVRMFTRYSRNFAGFDILFPKEEEEEEE